MCHSLLTDRQPSNTMSINHQTPASRPLLVFKHNPKAGGGSIHEVLQQLKPNKLSHNDAQILIDTDESFVEITEFERVSLRDKSHGFVISSIREPCDHYLSLWAFGSDGKGSLYHSANRMDHSWSVLAYGKDPPFFDSDRDIASFQNDWLRHDSIRGLITKRFLQSFGFASRSKPNPPEAVDCWVFVDDFQASLVSCLQQFEDQGGSVNWNAPLLSAMVQELQDKEHGRKTVDCNKNDPLNNVQLTHHSKCSTYFDNATAKLIQEGDESFIYDMFGYAGCCQPTRTNKSLSRIDDDHDEDEDEDEDDVEAESEDRELKVSANPYDDAYEYGKPSGNMATTIRQFENRSGPSARVLAGAITGAGIVIVSLVLRKVIRGTYNRRRLYQRAHQNDGDDIEHDGRLCS